jgi:hypothetical protein
MIFVTHKHKHIHTQTYTHINIYIYIYIHLFIQKRTHTHTHIYIYIYIFIYLKSIWCRGYERVKLHLYFAQAFMVCKYKSLSFLSFCSELVKFSQNRHDGSRHNFGQPFSSNLISCIIFLSMYKFHLDSSNKFSAVPYFRF